MSLKSLHFVLILTSILSCQGRIVEEERSSSQDDQRGGMIVDMSGWFGRLQRGLSDVDHRLHELSASALTNVAAFFDKNRNDDNESSDDNENNNENDEDEDKTGLMEDLGSRLDDLLSKMRKHRLRSDWPNLEELDILVKERIRREQSKWADSIKNTVHAIVQNEDNDHNSDKEEDEYKEEEDSPMLSLLLNRLRPSSGSLLDNLGSMMHERLATMKSSLSNISLANPENWSIMNRTMDLQSPLENLLEKAQGSINNFTSTLEKLPATLLEHENELRQLQKVLKALPSTLPILIEANLPPLQNLLRNSSFTLDELATLHTTLVDVEKLIQRTISEVDEERAPSFVKMAGNVSQRNLLLMHFVLNLMLRADGNEDKIVLLNEDDLSKLEKLVVKPTEFYDILAAVTEDEDVKKD